jgi:carbonic anhydrase
MLLCSVLAHRSLRSSLPLLASLSSLLAQIYVIHHTDCGMLTFSSDQLRGIVKERLGHEDHTHYHEFR